MRGARSNVQLALDNEGTGGDDRVLLPAHVLDGDDVVAALAGHGVVLLLEAGLIDVADRSKDAQTLEEAAGKVGAAQGAEDVAVGEGGLDLRGDEVGGEEDVRRRGGSHDG